MNERAGRGRLPTKADVYFPRLEYGIPKGLAAKSYNETWKFSINSICYDCT